MGLGLGIRHGECGVKTQLGCVESAARHRFRYKLDSTLGKTDPLIHTNYH